MAALAPARDLSLEAARREERQIWFADGWRNATVWSRLDLPVGALIEGPAALEQPDATTIIDPGMTGRVDDLGNIVIERASE
jgi:N-methylhydantoinase A